MRVMRNERFSRHTAFISYADTARGDPSTTALRAFAQGDDEGALRAFAQGDDEGDLLALTSMSDGPASVGAPPGNMTAVA